ncbi:MAG: glycosyltransferase family 2 protein [Fibrobacter sp.]|nr:glycosyltransferase family 2 protein [Fibrobacter sp.]
MSQPLVSVIVLNWNGEKVLAECIDSLLSHDYTNTEIIIVDNASNDNSVKIAARYPQVKLVKNPDNFGYATGNNVGFQHANGKYIVTLNNDIVVDPGWLNEPVRLLENDNRTGVVSCRQMNYFNKNNIDCLYHYPSEFLIFLSYGAGEIFDKNNPLHSEPGLVVSANGASAVYRASLLRELNGFDETYFAYHEECDLCFRIIYKGYKCVYCPSSIVYHMHGYSFKPKSDMFIYYYERNRYRFILKNYPFFYILFHLHLIFYNELRIFAGLLLRNQFGPYLRARFHFFANVKRILQCRKEYSYTNFKEIRKFFKKKKISY